MIFLYFYAPKDGYLRVLPYYLMAHSGSAGPESHPQVHQHRCECASGGQSVCVCAGSGPSPLPTSPDPRPYRPSPARRGTGRCLQREPGTETR